MKIFIEFYYFPQSSVWFQPPICCPKLPSWNHRRNSLSNPIVFLVLILFLNFIQFLVSFYSVLFSIYSILFLSIIWCHCPILAAFALFFFSSWILLPLASLLWTFPPCTFQTYAIHSYSFFLSFFFFKVPTLQVTFVQLNSLVTYSELQHRFFYYTPNSHNLSWGFAIVSNFLFKTKVMFVFPLWSEELGSMTLLLKMFLLICLFLSIPYDVPFIPCWD